MYTWDTVITLHPSFNVKIFLVHFIMTLLTYFSLFFFSDMKNPNSDQGGKIKALQKRLDKISSVNVLQDEKTNNKDTCQGKINIRNC